MGRSKSKHKILMKNKQPTRLDEDDANSPIIPNLPEKFIQMKIKSGTKIRNVLKYAMEEFENHSCIVWIGAGQAVGKTISCVEIFKKKFKGLHQLTKLHSVRSIKSNRIEKSKEIYRVPEIHILLSKNNIDATEPGYAAPDEFITFKTCGNVKKSKQVLERSHMKEFESMGLRMGQKRSRYEHAMDSFKKSKIEDGSES